MEIRVATLADIDALVRVRLDFNDEWHPHSDEEHARFAQQFRAYLPSRIASGQFIGVLGWVDADVASAAFLLVDDYPANCSLPTGRVGTLLNVYTYSKYRRQGLGKQIIDVVLDKARDLKLDLIDLEATDMGRGLYEQAGFHVREYTPMRLAL